MESKPTTQQRTPSGNSDARFLLRSGRTAVRGGGTDELLSAREAARTLGITVTTFYDWLARSKIGELLIRGQQVTIDYFQGGARGQGRIQIGMSEVARLRELMRVAPTSNHVRRPGKPYRNFPGITVPLGRPI